MNLAIVLLSISTLVFMSLTYFFYKGCAILAIDNLQLKNLVKTKTDQLLSMELRHVVAAPPLVLNEKTQKLLKLAVSKNNSNEASAAALQVCKRLDSGRY